MISSTKTTVRFTRSFHVRIQGPLAANFNWWALEKDYIAMSAGGGPNWRDLSIWEEFLPEVEKWIEEKQKEFGEDAIEVIEIIRKAPDEVESTKC